MVSLSLDAPPNHITRLYPTQCVPLTCRSSVSARRGLLEEYAAAVRRMACAVLELVAEGLGVGPPDALARLVTRADSDCMLRVNHYPPRPAAEEPNRLQLTGFGEHTDPQIISVLRSNATSGLEIALRDGAWAAVPPDGDAFFVNVGDTLQVRLGFTALLQHSAQVQQ
jgi:gibberellin 2beta-dioxygenase